MEIQKIFSDLDGDERLYSVLMNEEEYDLFSELEERVYASIRQLKKQGARLAQELVKGNKPAVEQAASRMAHMKGVLKPMKNPELVTKTIPVKTLKKMAAQQGRTGQEFKNWVSEYTTEAKRRIPEWNSFTHNQRKAYNTEALNTLRSAL